MTNRTLIDKYVVPFDTIERRDAFLKRWQGQPDCRVFIPDDIVVNGSTVYVLEYWEYQMDS